MADRLNAKSVEQILGLYHDYQYGIADPDQIPRLYIFSDKEQSVDIYRHILPVDQLPHRVQAIEIQLVLDGSVSVNLNGKTISLEKNSLLILNQNVTRSLVYNEHEKAVVVHIYIDTKQFDQRFFTLVMDDNMFANYIYKSIYISNTYNDYILVKDLSSGVIDVLLSLCDECRNKMTAGQNNRVLYSWIAVLFLRLYDYCHDIEYSAGNEELETGYRRHLINGILNCIQENAKTATLTSVSKSVHLHPNYICKVIKESTGKTFTEILNMTKMRIATQMLESTDISLEKIALSIGFSNPNYFYKVFKNYSGQTPGQYRKERQHKSVYYLGSNEASEALHNAAQKDGEKQTGEAVQTSTAILQFTPMNSENHRIGFFPAASYKYIMEVGKGLSFSASKFGCMTRMYVPDRDNVNEQVKLLTSALCDRLDVIVVNAHDEYAVSPVLQRFIEKGTMVCLINRDDSQLILDVHTVIGYRQRKATKKLGEYVVKKCADFPLR